MTKTNRLLSILTLLLACSLFTATSRAGEYGALAVGISLGYPAQVSAGYALDHETPWDADKLALERCNNAGPAKCRIVSAFSGRGECGFISIGKGYPRQGGVGWGMGTTPRVALANCRLRVPLCEVPIGGCIQDARE